MDFRPMLPHVVTYSVLLGLAALVPGFWQPVFFVIFYMALAQALNIFLGLTGYVDFGYVAFMGFGSYGMGLAVIGLYRTGLPEFLIVGVGLILAVVFSMVLSLVVGGVALRLRGAYFAIATVGVSEGSRYLIQGGRIWGGSEGIILTGPLRQAFGATQANLLSTFSADVITVVTAITAAVATLILIRGKVGFALKALREDEDAARVMGVYVTKYKIIAFVLSAVFAALIGASAWTLKLTYVFPSDVFNIAYVVEVIVTVMIGGTGTLTGPLLGGLIYGVMKYYLLIIIPGFQLLVLAPLMLVIILFFPQGIVGALRKALGPSAAKYLQ